MLIADTTMLLSFSTLFHIKEGGMRVLTQITEKINSVDPTILVGSLFLLIGLILVLKVVKKAVKIVITVAILVLLVIWWQCEFTFERSEIDLGPTTKLVRELATEQPDLVKTNASHKVLICIDDNWIDIDDVDCIKWHRFQCMLKTEDGNWISVTDYRLKRLLACKFREVTRYE